MTTAAEDVPRYWRTEVSAITPETVYVRGYKLDDVIGMSFTAATFLMIKGRLPSPQETRVLDAVLTGVLDYGMEKSGTAAARYVVSCNPSMQAALAAAALSAGDYGLATENTARFIASTYTEYQDSGLGLAEFAEVVVARAKAAKYRIPGFGHQVFRFTDPRAQILKGIAVEAGLWGDQAVVYEAVHRAFIKQPGREHFPINDVAVLAAITVAMGFTPEESTALAILGTLPGVVAHISEELTSGKVQRLITPETVDYVVPVRDLTTDLEAAGWLAPRPRGLHGIPPASRTRRAAPGGAGRYLCPGTSIVLPLMRRSRRHAASMQERDRTGRSTRCKRASTRR